MAAKKSKAPLTDPGIDSVIRRNLRRLSKPGVVSVRPGVKISGGMLTNEPAIVASVRRKLKDLPPAETLPKAIDGIPVDVRQLSSAEALRATDPQGFAQELLRVPRGNVPLELHTPNFARERNLQGQLIGPQVDKAVARVRTRRPDGAQPKKSLYQKLPASALQPVNNAKVTCFASPDAGWPNLGPFLKSVKKKLTVGMFEFTAPHIVDAVSTTMKNKTLNLVLDDPGYDTTKREQTNDETHDELGKAVGPGLSFAWAAETADKHNSIHLFPAAYHIKVAVADSAALFLSSGNFNTTNQPDIDPVNKPADAETARVGDRDWHVIIESPALAATFENLILRDLQQALPGQQPAAPPVLKGNGNSPGKRYQKFFSARSFSGPMLIQPAVTPDNFGDVILPLIQSAKKRFWMQTQYIKPSAKFVQDVASLPVAKRSILEKFLDALRVLTASGTVDVKIIVDARVTASTIEQLQKTGGLDGKKILRQEHVHNKGMIIDDHTVVIGSQNWSTEGVDTNRDASVVINNPAMVSYWSDLFQKDWDTMTLPNEDPAA